MSTPGTGAHSTAERPLATRDMGVGIGFRRALAGELLARRPKEVRWLEVHPENYIDRGGPFRAHLEAAMDHWAVLPHGLTLCFGSEAAPDEREWLRSLRRFLDRIDAPFYSDHLCIAGARGAHTHDLLPMARTAADIDYAVGRVRRVADAIGRPVAIENVSATFEPPGTIPEAAFVAEVAERADAMLLLDVNNVVVNAHNFRFDPWEYCAALPLERVAQIHIAGHEVLSDGLRVDTHAEPVESEALALLGRVLAQIGPRPVLLERDAKIPPLDVLLDEVRAIHRVCEAALTDHNGTRVPA